jgi:hypothetical protein
MTSKNAYINHQLQTIGKKQNNFKKKISHSENLKNNKPAKIMGSASS